MITYFVLAHNYGQFTLWCQQNRLNRRHRHIVYLNGVDKVHGFYEYSLVFLEGWKHNDYYRDRDMVDYIGNYATHCHYWDVERPIASELGEIVGWKLLTEEKK